MRNSSRSGFTLIELLVFAAIFLIVSVSFVTILISITQVYVRQSATSEVNQQSLFVLQTVQRLVEQSSAIEMTVGETTSTLKLRMPSSTEDPTYIYFEPIAQAIWLRQTDSPAAPTSSLTTKNVKVVNLVFTKRSNATAAAPSVGHSSVGVTFTMIYNSQNPKQNFIQSLAMTVARVNAATFDSDIVPSASQNDTLKVGATGSRWKSINDLIYFSGNNVGIGVPSPIHLLDVQGPLHLGAITQPTGANGVMYYDSGLNKFRCYENNAWRDCGGAVSGGQTNYIPIWTSATTLGTSTIYQSGGTSIGIGTTTPTSKLHIVDNLSGGGSTIPLLRIQNISEEAELELDPGGTGSKWVFSTDDGTKGLRIYSDASERVRITPNGDLFLRNQNSGIFFRTSNGSCYLLTITDSGNFSTSSVTCPAM